MLNDTEFLFKLNYDHPKFKDLDLRAKRTAVIVLSRPDMEFRGYNPYAHRNLLASGGTGGMEHTTAAATIGRGGFRWPLQNVFASEQFTRGELMSHMMAGTITCQLVNAGRQLASNTGAGVPVSDDVNSWSYAAGFPVQAREIEMFTIEPRLVCTLTNQNTVVPDSIEKFIKLPRPDGSKVIVDLKRTAGAGEITVTMYAWNEAASVASVFATFSTTKAAERFFVEGHATYLYPVVSGLGGDDTISIYLGVEYVRP